MPRSPRYPGLPGEAPGLQGKAPEELRATARGPKSKIETSGHGLEIHQAYRSGSTLEEPHRRFDYPVSSLSRYLRKLERNAGDTRELTKLDNASPCLGEAVKLHKELVESEIVKQYRTANRKLEAASAPWKSTSWGHAPEKVAERQKLDPLLVWAMTLGIIARSSPATWPPAVYNHPYAYAPRHPAGP